MTETLTTANTPQGIQSVEIAFSILNCFKESKEPMTVSQLSEKSLMSKSKLHKYLVSFVRTGVLIKNKKDSTYSLGSKLIELGLFALQQFDVVSLAGPYMIDLKKEINQSIALAIWSEQGPMVVKYEESGRPINVEIQMGFHVPLLKSAVGKCFAAFMPPDIVNPLMQQEIAQFDLDVKDVENELAAVREALVSYRGSYFTGVPGVTAIASPIFDYTKNIVAVLCIIGFAGDLAADATSAEAQKLKETAKRISTFLS